MTDRHAGGAVVRHGTWLLGARLIAMSIGVIGMPVLMTALGPDNFGAWAVLMGGTFAFGTLELGLSSAVMRWATLAVMPPAGAVPTASINAVMSNALLCIALIFVIAGVPVFVFSAALAAWLKLPQTVLLTPAQCIQLVYVTVATFALFRCAIAPMLAARRIVAYANVAVAQSLFGAAVTWSIALYSHRLDLLLIANALAILPVQVAAAFWIRRRVPWRFEANELGLRLSRDMVSYGSALQFSDLSNFVMYQFDKLIIAGVVRPSEVTHYEVASRSAQALGNLPAVPFAAVAPELTERVGRAEDLGESMIALLRSTFIAIGAFLLLPLAVARIGLFAWVGQIGYHAADVFALLTLSIISTMLIMPLSLCAQAMGRASLEFRRALIAMLCNIPMSILLVRIYGKEGAAIGTLIACMLANLWFAAHITRVLQIAPARLLSALRPLLAPVLLSFVLVLAAALAIEPLVIASRWRMAPAAAGLYGLGVLGLLAGLLRGERLSASERGFIARLPILGALLARVDRERGRAGAGG